MPTNRQDWLQFNNELRVLDNQQEEDQYPEIFTFYEATIFHVCSDKRFAMSRLMPHVSRKTLSNKFQKEKKETEKSLPPKRPFTNKSINIIFLEGFLIQKYVKVYHTAK